ncbi:MAG: sirohydrochlorin chelatase [Opitutaceae bacterium]
MATTTFLMDNGSLQPAAVLQLREIASLLSDRVRNRVEPVSLLHSSGIVANRIQGTRAEILEPAIRARCKEGVRRFGIVPLFFGPSAALTDYVPERMAKLARDFPGLSVRVAKPVVDRREADPRIAQALADRVKETMTRAGLERPAVILADHGSPREEVAAVRNHVAGQLRAVLGEAVGPVSAASMERRPDDEYAFNEPLLARALDEATARPGVRDIVVSLLFFSPGRHAGPGGDIDEICRDVAARVPGIRIHTTAVLGAHPLLIDVLAGRWSELQDAPVRRDQTEG